jgi:hypothetical protein
MFLTPNLTATQHSRLQEALSRLTGLLSAPMVYMDADRIAGAWMLSPHHEQPRAADTAERLATEHHAPAVLTAYIAGMAFGVRLGRYFGKPRRRAEPRRTISEEYERLDPDDRREVAKMIHRLATGKYICTILEPREKRPPLKANPVEDDVAIARRWVKQAGVEARGRR